MVASAARFVLLVLLVGFPPATRTLEAQVQRGKPAGLENVGVEERLDSHVSKDLQFRNESGETVELGQYLAGDLPVILTLNYSDCPMLCGLQLNGLIDTLKACEYRPGREFRLVTVSLNPKESSERAALKKATYIERLGDVEASKGWNFLVGEEKNIRNLADSVGFFYQRVEGTNDYAHAAVSIVLTPDGRVSRYLYGLDISARNLKFALLEAGEGKIGSTMDQLLLFCFHYDATAGTYAPIARRIMSIGGGVVLGFVGLLILGLRWREKRRHSRLCQQD